MKKRLKITIEVDTEDPSAKEWETMEDYIATEMDGAIYFKNREDAELALATIKNEIEAREKGKVL